MHKHPLPWWLITDAQPLRAASLVVHRSTLALATFYWAGGCRPLPDDDASLARLALQHVTNWADHKHLILATFNTIRPALDTAFRRLEAKHARRSGLSKANYAKGLALLIGNGSTRTRAHGARSLHAPAQAGSWSTPPPSPPDGLFRE
jgi:hypothetical protein